MEQIEFPQDFSEFLKLLNEHHVEYLLIGGFAVAMHGYPRTTADMDVWVARRRENAENLVRSSSTDSHDDSAVLALSTSSAVALGSTFGFSSSYGRSSPA